MGNIICLAEIINLHHQRKRAVHIEKTNDVVNNETKNQINQTGSNYKNQQVINKT